MVAVLGGGKVIALLSVTFEQVVRKNRGRKLEQRRS